MNKLLTIKVYVGNEVLHTNQFFAGLGILHSKKIINAEFKKSLKDEVEDSSIKCIIENKKVAFEFHDREWYLDKKKYEWCDFYVKRSVSERLVKEYSKIIPWGLNVPITAKSDFAVKRSFLQPTLNGALRCFFRGNNALSHLLKIKNGTYFTDWSRFQQNPIQQNSPVIIFCSRLWDPYRVDGYKKEDRFILNKERIDFVQSLKKYFPKQFIGGIEESQLAKQLCPDLVLSPSMTHKKNYINQLKESSIGIATPGLVDSIGWKFAEYMLFSKAIVANDISNSLLNAPIIKDVNYKAYTSTESMLRSVEKLLSDKTGRDEMMHNNHTYAQKYLRPDRQLCMALQKIGFDISAD